MEKCKNIPAREWQAIVKSTREWFAKNHTAIIFAKDLETIEDVAPTILAKDLVDFGY